jgi:hypothetical protein
VNRFKQHIPNCISGASPVEFDFNSQAELLSHEAVSRWAQQDSFHRFSLSGNFLKAEFDQGDSAYVVGTISDPEQLSLPKYQITPTAKARLDEWNRKAMAMRNG